MIHDWENSKENAIPVKKGRTIQDLSHNPLKAPQTTEVTFEASIAENASNAEGLLSSYIQYYTWIRRRAGDNKASAKALLERATNDLLRFKLLANNIQYVKLWIEYADLVSDPNDVFSFMQSNDVGTKLSLFWIAWAFVAEKAQNYQLADNIFQNGTAENAEPKSLLSQRYQQFQRRITRKYLNAMENGETFTPLASSVNPKPLASSSFTTSQTFAKSVAPSTKSNSTFEVFADVEPNQSFNVSTSLPKKNRSFLANENQRLKENIGAVEKWTNPIMQSSAAVTVPTVNIPVFTDPECAPISSTVAVNKAPVSNSSFAIFDDSQQDFRAPTNAPVETLPSNVMVSTSIPVFVDSVPSPPKELVAVQQTELVLDNHEDQTINTKLALEDIEKMFTEEDFFATMDSSGPADNETRLCSTHTEESQEYVELEVYFTGRRRKFMNQASLPAICAATPAPLSVPSVSSSSSSASKRCKLSHEIQFSCENKPVQRKEDQLRSKSSSSFQYPSSSSIRVVSEPEFTRFQREWFEATQSSRDSAPVSLHHMQILTQMGKKTPHFSTPSIMIKSRRWSLHYVLARGKFGVAVQLCDENHRQPSYNVMKIDREHYSVHWEYTIHCMISKRLEEHSHLKREEATPWLDIQGLCRYQDCSAIFMPFVGKFTLISVLELLSKRVFDTTEQELLAASLTLQMVRAVHRLHSLELLHCDIKTDNWVVSPDGDRIRIHLIDFGKARPAATSEMDDPRFSTFFRDVVFNGHVSARAYRSESEGKGENWSYSVDYHGICCCMHQLLFLDELRIAKYSHNDAERRGFHYGWDDDHKPLSLPSSVLRRNWDKKCWAVVFATLLNSPKDFYMKADLDSVIRTLSDFLSTRVNSVLDVERKLCGALNLKTQYL